jgi:tetratricopeptide (TPR) repeat protein
MNRVFFFLSLLSILSPALHSQAGIRQQLSDLLLLEKQGHYDQAIRSLQFLIDGNSLGEEAGEAWTMLGFAYTQLGQFERAQKCDEQALEILKRDAPHSNDYATALSSFALLNNFTQGPEVSARLWTKALAVHTELGDHSGIAQDCAHLAASELERKHNKAGKKWLEQAIAEGELAKNMTDTEAIFLSDIHGWIANIEGDGKAELAAYQRSLELRQKSQGDNYPMTGWAYLYVGVAYADCRDWEQAMKNANTGLEILGRLLGRSSPQYFGAESLFAKVLDKKGLHDEASRIQKNAQQSMSTLLHEQCVGCTVSVASLR